MLVIRQSELIDIVIDINKFNHFLPFWIVDLERMLKSIARQIEIFINHYIITIFELNHTFIPLIFCFLSSAIFSIIIAVKSCSPRLPPKWVKYSFVSLIK